MNENDATEQAYKNGYAQGRKDCAKGIAKIIVKFADGYCNIDADRFEYCGDSVAVYSGDEMIGYFKTEFIYCIYKTTKEAEKR